MRYHRLRGEDTAVVFRPSGLPLGAAGRRPGSGKSSKALPLPRVPTVFVDKAVPFLAVIRPTPCCPSPSATARSAAANSSAPAAHGGGGGGSGRSASSGAIACTTTPCRCSSGQARPAIAGPAIRTDAFACGAAARGGERHCLSLRFSYLAASTPRLPAPTPSRRPAMHCARSHCAVRVDGSDNG